MSLRNYHVPKIIDKAYSIFVSIYALNNVIPPRLPARATDCKKTPVPDTRNPFSRDGQGSPRQSQNIIDY